MAAPLPTGSNVMALPTAPVVDPRLMARNPQAELATAAAGLQLGKELANLQNARAERELRAAQIKAEAAKAAYDLKAIDHAEQNLPTILGAKVQQALAEIEAAKVAAATSQAQLANNLPTLTAQTQAAQATNALAGARADMAFSEKTTPVKTQLLAAAQALGGMGIQEGGLSDNQVPPAFRETKEIEETDLKTGNTIQTLVTVDKRDQTVLSRGEPRIVKLGVDEKSISQATKEVTGIRQTIDLADKLKESLDKYAKNDKGGVGQAMATSLANRASTGPISVIAKAAGAKLQNEATVEITGAISNLKNTIANELFGSALSKQESENLNGMLPTPDDIADPERMKVKLKSVRDFLDTKLNTYRERNVLGKSLINDPRPAAQSPTTPANPVLEALTQGKTVMYNGRPMRMIRDAQGKAFLVPAQ